MATEENKFSNELFSDEFDEEKKKALKKQIEYEKELEKKRMEEKKKALEKQIEYEKELEEKRMEEIKRRKMEEEENERMHPKDAGPPRLKKNYGCEQKFIINFETEKSENHFSMEFWNKEKISDIIEKLKQRFNINARILLLFENKILDPDLLIAETDLYPYCTLKVIYSGEEQ